MATHPTRERLLELFEVDLGAGILRWRQSRGSACAGDVAGSVNAEGYCRLRVDGRHAMIHVIIWFLATGAWLPGKIDHRDRDRGHNAFANLRLATRSQNRANSSVSRRNKSGFKGVSITKSKSRPYWATIYVRGAPISLGYFSTPEAAASAYQAAARKHFGEFAAA